MGSVSKPFKVKLFNPLNRKQNLPIIIESTAATQPFSIETALSSCKAGMQLAPGGQCFFFLTYTAGTLGKQTGTFTITDNSKVADQTVISLSGATKTPKK